MKCSDFAYTNPEYYETASIQGTRTQSQYVKGAESGNKDVMAEVVPENVAITMTRENLGTKARH